MSKNKNKPMSKNQKVEYMHNATGLSYKECRKLLKKNNWDLFKAMGYDQALEVIGNFNKAVAESLVPAIQAMVDGTKKVVQSIADTINSIDWSAVIEEAKKIKEVQNERSTEKET